MNKRWYNKIFEKNVVNHIKGILESIKYPPFDERASLSHIGTETNKNYSYLNIAGIGPVLLPSLEKFHEYNRFLSGIGMLTAEGLAHFNIAPQIFKEYIARILKCSPGEIAFFENSSQAINIVLNSIDFSNKDIILTSDQEHPSGYLPLKRLTEKYGLSLYFIPYKKPMSFIKNFENVYKLSKDKTKLVFLSLSSYNSGNIIPVRELLPMIDRSKTFIYADAAQYAGVMKLDLEALDVDFLSFPGHKWYYGPLGTGILYINKKVKDRVKPSWISYNSVNEPDINADIELKNDAERFLCGTYDISKFLGLTISMMIIDKYHPEITKLHSRIFKELFSEISRIPSLSVYTKENQSTKGIISFKHRKIPPFILEQQAYEKYNIITKAINHPEKFPCLRISPGFLGGIEPAQRLKDFLHSLE